MSIYNAKKTLSKLKTTRVIQNEAINQATLYKVVNLSMPTKSINVKL